MKKHIFVLFAIITISGCSGELDSQDELELPEHIRNLESLTVYPADAEPDFSVSLIPVQSFGETDSILINIIVGAKVDHLDRVLLWERTGSAYKLHAYNTDGTYHSQIGRNGQGPGEYQFIRNLQIISGNIFIYDPQTSRVSRYDADDFAFQDSFMPQNLTAIDDESVRELRFSEIFIRNDGNYQLEFTGQLSDDNRTRRDKHLVVNPDGIVINDTYPLMPTDQMFTHREGNFGVSIALPFLGETLFALNSEDHLKLLWSNDFLIKSFDESGTYLSAFYYPVPGAPFDAEGYFEQFSSFQQFDMRDVVEKSINLPESWPAISQLKVDDENRIWVAVFVEDQEVYEWWILEEAGSLIGKFTWPRNKAIHDIGNGHIYTHETDETTGLQTIEKYRIQLTER